jgi:hypothetical protein
LTLDQGETFGDLHVKWNEREPVLAMAGAPSRTGDTSGEDSDEYDG